MPKYTVTPRSSNASNAAVTGRGERMRASGPVHREVRRRYSLGSHAATRLCASTQFGAEAEFAREPGELLYHHRAHGNAFAQPLCLAPRFRFAGDHDLIHAG